MDQPSRVHENGSDWDRFMRENGGHFLQSTGWQAVQERLGYETAYVYGSSWRGLAVILRRRAASYAYFPFGPVCLRVDRGADMVAELAAWLEREELSFARIEPHGIPRESLAEIASLVKTRNVQPECTWVIDLTVPVETLRSEMRSRLRGYINTAEKRGLAFRTSETEEEFLTFHRLLLKTAEARFETHGEKYYRTVLATLSERNGGFLRLAEHEGEIVAAVLSFESDTTRYYAHVAVDDEKNRALHASACLAWDLISSAKATGRTAYDFWGVLPEEIPGHPWNGFTTFKKNFGGKLVVGSGTWDLPIRKTSYRAARLAGALRR